jgi:hypothetical protein
MGLLPMQNGNRLALGFQPSLEFVQGMVEDSRVGFF